MANGGINYQWTPSSGLDNDTISNPTAKLSATTTFVIKVTGSNACFSYDTVIVTVDTALPAAKFTPDDLLGYTPLSIDFVNTSTGAQSYTWDFGDETSSGSMNVNHIYSSAGTYFVTLTAYNVNGCLVLHMVKLLYRKRILSYGSPLLLPEMMGETMFLKHMQLKYLSSRE